MDLSSTKTSALKYFDHYSLREKVFLLFSLGLLLLLLFLPIIEKGSLNSMDTETYSFFNKRFVKADILVWLTLLAMIAWNASKQFRQIIHRNIGFRSSDVFVNALSILVLTTTMFGIGDTINLLRENFSFKIDTAYGYPIILIYLILWLGVALFVSYTSQQKFPIEESFVTKEEDNSKAEAFKKIEKDFQWLFQSEKATDSGSADPVE